MKTAKLHVAVLEFTCPECGEFISSETGSHMFAAGEHLPETVECDFCETKLKVPAKAKKLFEGNGYG